MKGDDSMRRYIQKPVGEGKRFNTVVHEVINCITQRVTLKSACPTCEIISPLGPLKNVSLADRVAYINDVAVVWQIPHLPPSNCEETDLIKEGTGNMSRISETVGRIVDYNSQLEIIFDTTETEKLCNKNQSHFTVKGIPNAYITFATIEMEKKNESTRMTRAVRIAGEPLRRNGSMRPISDSRLCLTALDSAVYVQKCRPQTREQALYDESGQEFTLRDDDKLELTNSSLCVTYSESDRLVKLGQCNDSVKWVFNETQTSNQLTADAFRLHTIHRTCDDQVCESELCLNAPSAYTDLSISSPQPVRVIQCAYGNLKDFWYFQINVFEQQADPDEREIHREPLEFLNIIEENTTTSTVKPDSSGDEENADALDNKEKVVPSPAAQSEYKEIQQPDVDTDAEEKRKPLVPPEDNETTTIPPNEQSQYEEVLPDFAVNITDDNNETFVQNSRDISVAKYAKETMGFLGFLLNTGLKPLEGWMDYLTQREHLIEVEKPSLEQHEMINELLGSERKAEQDGRIRVREITIDHVKALMQQQAQFLGGRLVEQENVLADEIRHMYCSVTRLRRHQAILMSQFDGLLTARALGLNMCDRVTGTGESLVLQTCSTIEVELETIISICGPQPVVHINNVTYSLSLNGFSLVPYFDCLYQDQFISINGKPYTFLNGNWSLVDPIAHINEIKLIQQFDEIMLKELDLANHYPYLYDYRNLDRLTFFADLIGRAQKFDNKSMGDILISVEKANIFQNALDWIDYLKYGGMGLIAFVALCFVIRLIACCNPIPAILKVYNSIFSRSRHQPGHIPLQVIHVESPSIEPVRPSSGSPTVPQPAPDSIHLHNDTVYRGGRLYWTGCGCPVGVAPV